MLPSAGVRWLLPMALALPLAGCADNSMVMKGRMGQLEQQQQALTRQNQQFQDRATALDHDNQELGTLLAQSRQQSKVLEDQVAAMRDQLHKVTTQLSQVQTEKQANETRVQAMTASMQRQGGVTISPNNSLLQTLPTVSLPGVQVRRDGDVIRIELPGHRLFESGSAKLQASAVSMITDIATELTRTYPEQIIGVEGHTDSDRIASGQFRSNHELSVARAMAVYEVLIGQSSLQPGQFFVVGHGSNHPVVSNASAAGKERNRRVELVVYPERKSQ